MKVRLRKDRCRVFIVFLPAVFLLLIACTSLSATPIAKILDNPRVYSGKPVTISGEVTGVFGLVFVRYFLVKDKTGEIAVVTKRPLPKVRTAITVKGTVREAFALGDKQLIVLVENEER
ncbi:MAG: hypothetical protein M1497_00400 [Nitrospirae bacterium]|nr:hypothetical protein [Nitrospirota bacterium]